MDIPNIAELGEETGSVKKEEEEEESGEDLYGREPDAKRGKWFDPDIEIKLRSAQPVTAHDSASGFQ